MSERVSIKDRTNGPERDSALSNEKKPVPSSPAPSAYDVPFLQTTIGNRALYGLFKAGVLQPKLAVGRPNDPYEQEADRVAEQVMNSGGKGQQSGVESRELIVRGPGSGVQSQKFGDSGGKD
jgi:hypothetical protein